MTNTKQPEPTLYLRVRTNKQTFYLDFPANKSILDVKTEISTILPDSSAENIRLYHNTVEKKDEAFMDENKILKNLNITEDNAMAHKGLGVIFIEKMDKKNFFGQKFFSDQ